MFNRIRPPARREIPTTPQPAAPVSSDRARARTAFTENLPKPFRQRSLSPDPPAALRRTSPWVESKFGVEMETAEILLEPGGARHSLISDLPHTLVEIDKQFVSRKSDCEFISKASRSLTDLLQHGHEVVSMVDDIRHAAFSKGSNLVTPAEAGVTAVLGQENQAFKLNHVAPQGRLQSTLPLQLENLGRLLPHRKNGADVQRKVEQRSALVNQRLARACSPLDIPPNVQHFAKLIIYYMTEAEQKLFANGTEHGNFHFMFRTDFRTRYLNFSREERALIRVLLQRPGDGREPLMLRALDMKGSTRFFKYGYKPRHNEVLRGPKIQTVFDSILDGREDGRFEKDALSPCPGREPHTGDRRVDYPMGAWGLDGPNDAMLVEIRGRVGRNSNVLLNSHYLTALKMEMKFARELEPEILGSPDDIIVSQHELDWAERSYAPIRQLADLMKYLQNHPVDHNKRELKNVGLKEVARFGKVFEERGWGYRYPDVQEALAVLDRRMSRVRKTKGTDYSYVPVYDAITKLMTELWDVNASANAERDFAAEEAQRIALRTGQ